MAYRKYSSRHCVIKPLDRFLQQTHEVIGSPPNVAVPTHFAKVVLTTKPSSPSAPNIPEISTGAFVLPNIPIPDEAPLKSFVVPGKCLSIMADLGRKQLKRFVQSIQSNGPPDLFCSPMP